VGQRFTVAVELAAEPARYRRLLRVVGTTPDDHHGYRRRRGSPVGALVEAGRRSSGDGQRGETGRQRDVRAERVAPRQRAQAVDDHEQHPSSEQHVARADPKHAYRRRQSDAHGPLCRACRSALLRGTCLPHRLSYSGDDLRAERDPAGVVVRSDRPGRRREGVDRVLREDALGPDPPVVPGENVPTGLPACPSLRNEPCRPYVALANRASAG
jgi:hypothetical protein